MNITWDQVKAHVKRNRTRYIVLGGVALGMAIGYSTKRANVNTIKQVADAAKGTYKLALEGAEVAVNITPQEAASYNVAVEAIRKAFESLPEAMRTVIWEKGVPEGVTVAVAVGRQDWERWQKVAMSIADQILAKSPELPKGIDFAPLIPTV